MWTKRPQRGEANLPATPQSTSQPVISRKITKTQSASFEERLASLNVPYENPIQAAKVLSNAFPEQAVRFAAMMDDKNVPIRFYGVCLNQNGTMLEGVKISFSVRQWHGTSRLDLGGDVKKFAAISDKSGRFSLTGVKGDVAGIDQASKEGYEWIQSGRVSVNFWNQKDKIPTPDDPVILRFWKKQGAQPMYRYSSSEKLVSLLLQCDGTPQGFDLYSGNKVAENPKVRFSFERNPAALPLQFKGRFDWAFTVEIPGGKIQLTETNMPYLAPFDGYQQRASIGFKADDPNWNRDGKAQFYFITPKGEYGRLEAEAVTHIEGPRIRFSWAVYLNPSGSRNLEYDPAMRLDPPKLTGSRDNQSSVAPAAMLPVPPQAKGVESPPNAFPIRTNFGPPFSRTNQPRSLP